RSNGVAVGPDLAAACRAAELELVERHRVLASWYGEATPRLLEMADLDISIAPAQHYVARAYAFTPETAGMPAVVGMFAFPREAEAPFAMGLAAGAAFGEAIARAAAELRQCLGFLWGETIPTEEPSFATNVEFHQEWYLRPASHARLRAWLAGEHRSYAGL